MMQTIVVPYCGAAPLPADLLWRWNLDPMPIAVTLALCLLLRARGAAPVPLFVAGALTLLLFVSPLCALASALFSARVAHHIVLTAAVAPLLALALPRGGWGLTTWVLAHAAVFWTWHAPGAYAFALSSDWAYWLMELTLLGSALGLWRAIRAASPTAAIGALLITMVQMGLLGALLTFAATPFYDWHAVTTMAWGLSPVEDQQLAGLVMWVPGAGFYLFAALRLANGCFRDRQRLAAA
jgi:putative membrane protein